MYGNIWLLVVKVIGVFLENESCIRYILNRKEIWELRGCD